MYKHEHYIDILFIFFFVTFSLTYSFDVLVEAVADAASSRLLLNLQSSALAATRLLAPSCSLPLLLSSRTLIRHAASTHLTLVWGQLSCADLCWFLRILLLKRKTFLVLHQYLKRLMPLKWVVFRALS
ncbi:hypothetical protein B296_00051643 [Ensete ventricosum]|uniref:Uncharacterized protein n=1 Tax=Ensete ventricosum TaxID=4639 RepID=A0A426X6Y8_ENSVE|nr:hypothetical protein B296_00051643 [Ensete ventricosum]